MERSGKGDKMDVCAKCGHLRKFHVPDCIEYDMTRGAASGPKFCRCEKFVEAKLK
jgi:hypothetical protein